MEDKGARLGALRKPEHLRNVDLPYEGSEGRGGVRGEGHGSGLERGLACRPGYGEGSWDGGGATVRVCAHSDGRLRVAQDLGTGEG
eukprot:6066283-Prymnesium_polylepis.1